MERRGEGELEKERQKKMKRLKEGEKEINRGRVSRGETVDCMRIDVLHKR